jgi:hypothetical protein
MASETVAHLDQLAGERFEHRQGMLTPHHTKRRLRDDVPQRRCRVFGLARDGDDQAVAIFRDPKASVGLAEHAALDSSADSAPSLLASMLLDPDPSESTLDIVHEVRSPDGPDPRDFGRPGNAGTCCWSAGDQNTVTP